MLTALVASTFIAVPARGADGFPDVAPTYVHGPAINALAELGVFADTGCREGLFCPEDPIKRWVMAVWLIRVLGGEGTASGVSRFADVDGSRWWSAHTEELADREITRGCLIDPPRYCPDQSVTRGEMASFLVRAFDLPTAPAAGFTDTEANVHRTDIDALAAEGITRGCGTEPFRYCPDQPVTRGEMATFLHRARLWRQAELPEPGPFTISDDVPDYNLADMSTGATVNLRSLVTGDKPLLLWFWSPY